MTKKQELQVMELIINDGGVKDGYTEFWQKYRSNFTFTLKDLRTILEKYRLAGDIDEDFNVTEQMKPKYITLKQEVENEEKRLIKSDEHLGNQFELVKRQKRFFWVPIIISLFAVAIAFFKPTPKYDDTKLKEYIKIYVDSTRSEIREDIDDTKINILDIIYSDSSVKQNITK